MSEMRNDELGKARPNSERARITTAEEMRKRCPISLPWLAIYIAAWQLVLCLIPDEFSASYVAQSFVKSVAQLAPSILAYSANSPDPARVALFMAVHWCLCPIYAFFAFRCWGRKLGNLPNGPKPSSGAAALYIVFFLGIGLGLMMLPEVIALDAHAIRPSRVWGVWMHESLIANGIIGVALPMVVALMLLAAWSCFLVIPTVKNETTKGVRDI